MIIVRIDVEIRLIVREPVATDSPTGYYISDTAPIIEPANSCDPSLNIPKERER